MFRVNREDSVQLLRGKVAVWCGEESREIILYHGGKELQDGRELRDYQLDNGSNFTVLCRGLKGGSKEPNAAGATGNLEAAKGRSGSGGEDSAKISGPEPMKFYRFTMEGLERAIRGGGEEGYGSGEAVSGRAQRGGLDTMPLYCCAEDDVDGGILAPAKVWTGRRSRPRGGPQTRRVG